MNVTMRSRVRERRTHGSVRGLRREPLVYSTIEQINRTKNREGWRATMEYKDYIKQGLNGNAPLKLILCGNIQGTENDKVGVVSVVYATNDKDLAEQKMNELIAVNPNNYYMVYSVPLNVDLTELSHYPSIAISKDDLQ